MFPKTINISMNFLLDTISNRGGNLKKETLAEKVLDGFSKVRLKKAFVKVPKLRIRKRKVTKLKNYDKTPISSIINILIKTSVEKVKKERAIENGKSYHILKGDKLPIANGGYGTVSKGYGSAPHTSYVDYGKLFSYLGKFRSQSAYENMGNHTETLNKSTESGSFTLIERETMEKGKTYVRYFNSKIPIDKSSLVPIAGMNSAEWEQFKMWMRLDTAMYLLKISTS